MKTSYNESEKEKHISLLPIENQDQMSLGLWALSALEEVTAWRKPRPALALASPQQHCAYLFLPCPRLWREIMNQLV